MRVIKNKENNDVNDSSDNNTENTGSQTQESGGESLEFQPEKLQEFYEKVSDLLDAVDPEGKYHEELLMATTQAVTDKVAQSYEEEFQYYLVKELGDMMHAFCIDYAQTYLADPEEDSEEDFEDSDESAQSPSHSE